MAGAYPRRFGKYVLLKPMARGGMGEIYLAATGETGLEKCCVIKKIIAERSDRAKANRFLDEAKVVLRLTHANLVPTFDAGEIDGEFFIAMDLVEGKDLREIWNRCVRTRTRSTVACRARSSPDGSKSAARPVPGGASGAASRRKARQATCRTAG